MNIDEIKAREQAANEAYARLPSVLVVYDKLINPIINSADDVCPLIFEVERLTEENHKQFETIGQQGREMNRRDEIIKQQDQETKNCEELIESYKESSLEQATENYELENENATLKKALELVCFEFAVSSCPCSLVDGCDTCPDEKQGDWEGATREKRGLCWEKYYMEQAQQTHETQEAEK